MQEVMEEKCGSAAICFVAFLPDILDSKAEGRNKYLELLLSVAEKFKRSPYRHVFNLLICLVFIFFCHS
jgi:protein disulfide-isomerase A6